ncbi:MAG: hypothetical protein AAF437_08785 [Pseudomonadota bacterium]
MNPPARVSYWLLPCDQDAERFQAAIDALADAQNAPAFGPHMSLASIAGQQPDLQSCLDRLRGLKLEPLEIDATDVFTMSLFVRVKPNPALLQARTWMEAQAGFQSQRAFDPHLSLCYGPPPAGAQEWRTVRATLKGPILFDRLAAVDIPPRVETYDHIRAWKILDKIGF